MGNCFASRYQAHYYRGETPGGGWFASCQSRGATGYVASGMTICCAVFLSILGILLIAGGVAVGYYPEKLDPIFFYVEDVTDHEFLPSYQLAIAIGVFLCVSATCACCCVCFKFAACCLLLAFIMIIVVIGCLSHSVKGFDSDGLKSDIKKNMLSKINGTSSYRTDTILDYIQQKIKCCGVEGPSDWQTNSNFGKETVPDSCCKVETSNCGKNYRPDDIFHDGCLADIWDKIAVYFGWQLAFLAIFSLIAVLIICLCCCIADDDWEQ